MLCDANKCTGCSACFAACNFDAISMIENELGVLQPQINAEKCKSCGICEKVCPVIQNTAFELPKACYAAYTKNRDDIDKVASGGLATAFGRFVASNGGAVFGTVLGKNAHFEYAENEDELDKFRGSKYVYVFPDRIYRDVKIKLDENRLCLFVGTPCQVDGLKAFLRKDYDNLITVDLICHGTPPFAYLKAHLSRVDERYEKVTFRGEKDFSLTCYDAKNDIVYSEAHHHDEYFYSFLNALTYREVCYNCAYAKKERVSDITIGDFWGLAPDALNGYKGKKSVALINTDKGLAFFEKIKEHIVFEERTVDEAVAGNAQLRKPSVKDKRRDAFIQEYAKSGWIAAIKKSGIKSIVSLNRFKTQIKSLLKNE